MFSGSSNGSKAWWVPCAHGKWMFISTKYDI
jgi:hypothetical protein